MGSKYLPIFLLAVLSIQACGEDDNSQPLGVDEPPGDNPPFVEPSVSPSPSSMPSPTASPKPTATPKPCHIVKGKIKCEKND